MYRLFFRLGEEFFVFGVVFATVLNKFVPLLWKLTVNHKLAVLIVLAAVATIGGLILRFIIPALVDQVLADVFFSGVRLGADVR